MTTALAWLNDLIQWFGRWVPRLVLIPPTHRGVRFGPRGGAKQVGPGLVLYWPMTHDLVQIATTLQSIQLCAVQLPVKDDGALLPRVALCTLNVQFRIMDAVKAATRILHFHALVGNRVQAAVASRWPGSLPGSDEWVFAAKADLVDELADYGIELVSLDVAGLGLGVSVKNISDWSYADSVDGRN